MHPARTLIQRQVRQLFGRAEGEIPADDPPGDAGLFGPDSACWRVHGDFTSMMIGGVSALLLQMLHPAALAGVWDHTDFRRDMSGRLRRTANFIAGTTYGPTDTALALIDRVRAIHDRVEGRLPDGAPYTANDPELLTWVHVAEVSSFLGAWIRHRDPGFAPADQDRYYAETATIARRLGATEVPVSRSEVSAYLARMRPRLRADYRTREVARALLTQKANPAMAPFMTLVFRAGQDLLPPWAAQMHGVSAPLASGPALRLGAGAVGAMLRWALPNGAEARARRRVAGLG